MLRNVVCSVCFWSSQGRKLCKVVVISKNGLRVGGCGRRLSLYDLSEWAKLPVTAILLGQNPKPGP